MANMLSNIRRGMQVRGTDGEPLGTIIAVRQRRLGPGGGEPAAAHFGATHSAAADLDPPAQGQLGTFPLGTTTAKDRGGETALNRVALRDPETLNPATSAPLPGAAGANIMRGYGPRRRDVDDGASEASARSATGDLDGAGVAETESAILASNKAMTGETHEQGIAEQPFGDVATAFLVVEDPGTLGVMAGGMRIPISAVRMVEPGLGAIVDCSAAEARERWKHLGLDLDETADVLPY